MGSNHDRSAATTVIWCLVIALVLFSIFPADHYFSVLATTRSTPLLPDFLWIVYGVMAIGLGLFAILQIRTTWVRYFLYAATLICLIYLAYIKMGRPGFGVDDANIFMAYARNLRQGYGFVYNPNGERVEGFSSMLWVLLMSGTYFISAAPENILLLLNIGILFGSVFLVLQFLSNRVQRPREKILLEAGFLLILSFSPEYLSWMSLTLMDTGLWSLLLVASALVILDIQSPVDEKSRRRISLLLAALVLTRPESIVWGMVFLALAGFRILILQDGKAAIRWIALPLTAFLGTITLLTVFRLVYFGFPFPNTYYAKVSPSIFYNFYMGFYYYFLEFGQAKTLYAIGILVVLGWVGAGAIRWIRTRGSHWHTVELQGFFLMFCLACVNLAGLVIPILYGGDHFYSFRQYQPFYPLFLALILLAGIPILRHLRAFTGGYTWAGFFWLAVPILFFFQTDTVTWKNVDQPGKSIKVEFDVAWKSRNTGDILSRIFSDVSELPSVGVLAAGGIKQTYSGEVIDLLGLNSVPMGHSTGKREGWKNHAAFDLDVFFQLAPTIVLVTCDEEDPDLVLDNIQLDERFQQQYTCVLLQESNGDQTLPVAIRRDYLSEILLGSDSAGIKVTVLDEE